MIRIIDSELIRITVCTVCLIFTMVSISHSQDADNRPLVAVYPMKIPQNQIVADIIENNKLDLSIIVLKTEEGLRNSKKMRLFERAASGLSSVNQEQMRAACGNGSQTADGIECEKHFSGNAAATGQLSNVEFVIELEIMDLSIGEVVYRNIPEMPGKMRRSVASKLDLAVKVLDSTSGQIKFQSVIIANYTESGIALDKSDSNIDKHLIWNGLAVDAGKKAATSIIGAMN